MKVFISWSGEKSRKIAEFLRIWLKDVIHFLEPWMSSEDIRIGSRWSLEIAKKLEECNFGIICISKENYNSPWILFESGALSKLLGQSLVCPYLLDLKTSDLTGPLVQFQSIIADKENTKKLLQTINKNLENNSLTEEQLDKSFEKWWPDLEKELITTKIKNKDEENLIRTEREMLEEILDLTRFHITKKDEFKDPFIRENSLIRIFESINLQKFINKIEMNGDDDDLNAKQWFINTSFDDNSNLNGSWYSRWNGGNHTRWLIGKSCLLQTNERVFIFTSDRSGIYLTIARVKGQYLEGNCMNIKSILNYSPWFGLVVNENRIDGQWSEGRWDFRR